MAGSEKLCLQWNEFPKIVIYAFRDLRVEEDFADVSLVCGDGKQVEAHKVVLASTSPFFREVFKKHKHSHPLIFMRGVNYGELVAMVEFLYKGEANVDQSNLDNFLALADELKLKGLNGTNGEEEGKSGQEQLPRKLVKPNHGQVFEPTANVSKPTYNEELVQENGNKNEGVVALNTSNEDLNSHIMSMMGKSENCVVRSQGKGNSQGKARICKVCGKKGAMKDIQKHIEANHISGFVHSCNICEIAVKTRHALAQHIARNHNRS